MGCDAFASAGESELLAGRGLYADASNLKAHDLAEPFAHLIYMGPELRCFAHDCNVGVGNHTAALFDHVGSSAKEDR